MSDAEDSGPELKISVTSDDVAPARTADTVLVATLAGEISMLFCEVSPFDVRLARRGGDGTVRAKPAAVLRTTPAGFRRIKEQIDKAYAQYVEQYGEIGHVREARR